MQEAMMRMDECVKWARVTQCSGRKARSDAWFDDDSARGCGPGTFPGGRTAECGSALRGRSSGELGCGGGESRRPRDGERGRRADGCGDARERRCLGRRSSARDHLTERALIGMDGAACRRSPRLDVCAGGLAAFSLEADVGVQRDRRQRELQHCPQERKGSPRRMASHERNVGVASPPCNAGTRDDETRSACQRVGSYTARRHSWSDVQDSGRSWPRCSPW
jgi:hypothetical protein